MMNLMLIKIKIINFKITNYYLTILINKLKKKNHNLKLIKMKNKNIY